MQSIKQGRLADVVRMLGKGTSAHDFGDFGDAFVRPIAVATGYGHIDIIKALIARGADAEATCCSNMGGAWKGNPASLHGCKALHIAAAVGNAEACWCCYN
ncbi:hypothetical protein Esi_0004_0084 [Ectocarpus siliculosus]|uniref:Uncharacterized protein n=1 Tax=Ectocarpus siliculosus TaxID=2880 RepID=D8LMB3_ECTSI|nr:hypothetical protein Esi_0004_0084 [Ectocarpus siliculosus]|eukprot:CBN77523.1 hypothetical protein Esi_0004_0084 [Ectocarpus siliculosus]